MSEVLDYRTNAQAKARWASMDTDEPVIARYNGLPVTVSSLIYGTAQENSPCEYTAPDQDSA